jgi:hypothetical protein
MMVNHRFIEKSFSTTCNSVTINLCKVFEKSREKAIQWPWPLSAKKISGKQ